MTSAVLSPSDLHAVLCRIANQRGCRDFNHQLCNIVSLPTEVEKASHQKTPNPNQREPKGCRKLGGPEFARFRNP